MIFYKKYNFAFQHVNRTGGTSIKTAIKNLVGDPDEGSYPFENAHRSLVDCLEEIRELHSDLGIDDIPIYTSVRDPFSRLVSIFSFRKNLRNAYKGKGFRWFFYKIYMKDTGITNGPIRPYIVDEVGKIPKNLKITRFEYLPKVWPRIILRHFNKKVDSLPTINASKHSDPIEYFDSEMIELTVKRERWTLERFYPEILESI